MKMNRFRASRLAWDFIATFYVGIGFSLLSVLSLYFAKTTDARQLFLFCALLAVLLLLFTAFLLSRYVSGADENRIERALERMLFAILLIVGASLFFFWRNILTEMLLRAFGLV